MNDPGHSEFVRYYETESLSDKTVQRFRAVKAMVERVLRSRGVRANALEMADIGCGVGMQCLDWARDGHHVHGLDINAELVALGRERARQQGMELDLRVGTATALPWADASMDVCLAPELLEHVPDWRGCVREFSRILRPGGVLYVSTSNSLCPIQNEFDLPLYSWYPASMKRRYERLAVTTRPELVSHAQYPAVNWFTFYSLRRQLRGMGFDTVLDRFDLMDIDAHGLPVKAAVRGIRALPPLRLLGQMATEYTVALAFRTAA